MTDRRAGRSLRLAPAAVAAAARKRYGRPLTAEREARLAERLAVDDHLDPRGLRSAIGRELVAELRQDLTKSPKRRKK